MGPVGLAGRPAALFTLLQLVAARCGVLPQLVATWELQLGVFPAYEAEGHYWDGKMPMVVIVGVGVGI